MAKPMTKSKIVAALAEEVEIPKKTSAAYLEALASLAHKEAKNGFTIPGVGKLVVRNYKARMGRNPQTGAGHQDPGPPAPEVRGGEGGQGRRPRGREVESPGAGSPARSSRPLFKKKNRCASFSYVLLASFDRERFRGRLGQPARLPSANRA